MASKHALVILGLLAMVVLVPPKMTAARDFAMQEKWERNAGTSDLIKCKQLCCTGDPVRGDGHCKCCEKLPSTEKWERNAGTLDLIKCKQLCCTGDPVMGEGHCYCCEKLPSTEIKKYPFQMAMKVEGSGGIGGVKLLEAPGQ